jgi:hypothetical protein
MMLFGSEWGWLARSALRATCCGYMTFAGGFAEANVAKPEAIAKHILAVVWLLPAVSFIFLSRRLIFLLGRQKDSSFLMLIVNDIK